MGKAFSLFYPEINFTIFFPTIFVEHNLLVAQCLLWCLLHCFVIPIFMSSVLQFITFKDWRTNAPGWQICIPVNIRLSKNWTGIPITTIRFFLRFFWCPQSVVIAIHLLEGPSVSFINIFVFFCLNVKFSILQH